MKVLIGFIGGLMLGRHIYKTVAENNRRQQEVEMRKRLETFMKEHLPGRSLREEKLDVEYILRGVGQ